VITYTIDGRGRRVAKAINGTRVKAWLYADQLRPIAELDGSGNLVSRFVYGTKPNVPEYIVKNGVTYLVFSGTADPADHHLRTATYKLTNTTSLKSLMYGIGPDWERSSFRPMSNMTQTYTWTEPIK
jgi:hypothetical protein